MTRHTKSLFEFGEYQLDASKRLLFKGGHIVQLTSEVFDILLALVQSGGRVLTKDDLIRKVWPEAFVEEDNLAQDISILRKILGERFDGGQYIEAIPRGGYRFVANVTEIYDEAITRYLLGGLSEEEREALEDKYFSDDSVFEEMTIVEDELIDSYLRGELPKTMHEEFEKSYFSSPVRHKRVMAAARFRDVLLTAKTQEKKGFNLSKLKYWLRGLLSFFATSNHLLVPSLAFALLLLGVGSVWVVIKNMRLQNQISQVQAEKQALEEQEKQNLDEIARQKAANDRLRDENQLIQNQSEKLKAELENLSSLEQRPDNQTPDASFELAFNVVRGSSSTPSFEIPHKARSVELRLNLEENDYKRFRVELQGGKGKIRTKDYTRRQIASSNKQVTIRLPASLLSTGHYTITLSGALRNSDFNPVAEYYFHIVKK